MTRVLINVCSFEDLMSLPGIGAKGADKILELREAKGDLELENLNQVPYLGLIPQLINCLDFTSFENNEGLGSLYERHRERVRSVDQLVEKWEGTRRATQKERGMIGANSTKSHQQGGNPIIVSRKGTDGNSHSHPRDLKMNIASWMQLS